MSKSLDGLIQISYNKKAIQSLKKSIEKMKIDLAISNQVYQKIDGKMKKQELKQS